jgi:hypothetical protein
VALVSSRRLCTARLRCAPSPSTDRSSFLPLLVLMAVFNNVAEEVGRTGSCSTV